MNTQTKTPKSVVMAPRHIREALSPPPEATDEDVLAKMNSLKCQYSSFRETLRQVLGMPIESTDEELLGKLTSTNLSSALKELQDRGMSYTDAWCRLKKDPRFTNYFKKAGTDLAKIT